MSIPATNFPTSRAQYASIALSILAIILQFLFVDGILVQDFVTHVRSGQCRNLASAPPQPPRANPRPRLLLTRSPAVLPSSTRLRRADVCDSLSPTPVPVLIPILYLLLRDEL